MIRSVLFLKRGKVKDKLQYIKCCNLFYRVKCKGNEVTPPHQNASEAQELLFTKDERDEVDEFVKTHLKRKRSQKSLKTLYQALVELAKGFELCRIDEFIESLPRAGGCFQFPLKRKELRIGCFVQELNQRRRGLTVLKRHDLIIKSPKMRFKVEQTSATSTGQCSDLSLSPTAHKIRSLKNSSKKKLKIQRSIKIPQKAVEVIGDAEKQKKSPKSRKGFLKSFKDSVKVEPIELWSLESSKSKGSRLNDNKAPNPADSDRDPKSRKKPKIIRPFFVEPPVIKKEPSQKLPTEKWNLEHFSEEVESQAQNSVKQTLNFTLKEFEATSSLNTTQRDEDPQTFFSFATLKNEDEEPTSEVQDTKTESSPDCEKAKQELYDHRMGELKLLQKMKALTLKKKKEAELQATEDKKHVKEARRRFEQAKKKARKSEKEADRLSMELEGCEAEIKDLRIRLGIKTEECRF